MRPLHLRRQADAIKALTYDGVSLEDLSVYFTVPGHDAVVLKSVCLSVCLSYPPPPPFFSFFSLLYILVSLARSSTLLSNLRCTDFCVAQDLWRRVRTFWSCACALV